MRGILRLDHAMGKLTLSAVGRSERIEPGDSTGRHVARIAWVSDVDDRALESSGPVHSVALETG